MALQTMHVKLSNLQLELLKVFHYQLPEHELIEIKDLLAQYFAQKATDAMNRFWEQQQLTTDSMDAWLHEHRRTPYQ
ncbi:hypothetical protein U14_00041 [Candidatus Moduliflexus flocculans]|uniref:Uncharacterized protein n=1 Tax=Candidatus Moduliflexus flocculans TaxID=1499966 RepID=A0A0S6VVZ3_9BACT|nr:hypothetical protein U14_00041 [Candidatus Moduliflexus flocculans]